MERVINHRALSGEKSIDHDTCGKIVHIYFTGNPQTQCLGEMNFSNEDLSKYLITLNMFHLRSLEQGVDIVAMGQQEQMNKLDRKRKHDGSITETKMEEPFDNSGENLPNEAHGEASSNAKEEQTPTHPGIIDAEPQGDNPENGKEPMQIPYRQKMREESTNSYNMMKDKKMDGLIIAAKQHPTNILLHLIKYLAPSRPFVVFSSYKEPLMDAYFAVKETGKTVFVTLSETWLRNYQVLPDRTHPEVLMSGGGGYILSGIVVDNTGPAQGLNEFASQNTVNGHSSERKNKRFRRK